MKAPRKVPVLFLTAGLFSVVSCDKEISAEFIGSWEAGSTEITVRTQDDEGEYHFISDTASAKIQIFSDNTASGTIGSASFSNVDIKKNFGNPKNTGIAYIVKCGKISKIFPDDPLSLKEVQIWLTPVENEMMEGELRYTEGIAHFPMAGLMFYRTE
jgi:hypothetical protein